MITIARVIAWLIGTLLTFSGKYWISIFRIFLKVIGSVKVRLGQARVFTNTTMSFQETLDWASGDKLPCVMNSDQGKVFLMHGTPSSFMVGLSQPIIVPWEEIGNWAPTTSKSYWLFSCGAGFRAHSILSRGIYFRNIPETEQGGVAALSPVENGVAIWASTIYDCLLTAPQALAALIKREITVKQYLCTMLFYVK